MSEDAGVGFEYKPVPVSFTKRDVLLFANSIGCTADELHFLYELDPNFQPFPTYPIILPFKGTQTSTIDFYATQSSSRANSNLPSSSVIPTLDSRRVVHGEQSIEFLHPLPTSSSSSSSSPSPSGDDDDDDDKTTLQIKTKILAVHDKGKAGTVVETQHLLVDTRSDTVFSRAVGSSFFVGQGGWGGPKGPKTVAYPPPEGKRPDVQVETPTTGETALLYRLNGDYNPLHASPLPGQKMGFGGTIIHGLYSWNTACHALLKSLGDSNPANTREFAARFASPVRPGDTLVTQAWRTGTVDEDGWEDVRFVTKVKEGGKVCLGNGRAKMKCSGGKSKL